MYTNFSECFYVCREITLARKEETDWTTVTCFAATSSTVNGAGVRFSYNQKVFLQNVVLTLKKSSYSVFFKSKLWGILREWQTSEV